MPRCWRSRVVVILSIFILLSFLFVTASPLWAQSVTGTEFTTLYSFTGSSGDGAHPNAGLILDSAGNLYGTTMGSGGSAQGTVFELVNSSGTYTVNVLHNFTNANGDGESPRAGLIMDSAGNLYGTTMQGGANGWEGAVFELVKNSDGTYSEQLLHSFANNNIDGVYPQASLIMDSARNLYGTTGNGGSSGAGTVFELVKSSTGYSEQVLYSFSGGADGSSPQAGLIMDSAGNLYGTTGSGGSSGDGTVFELVKSSTGYTEKVLYSFKGGSDGRTPVAGLLMDSVGNLYGTTESGGGSTNCDGGCGTVFELVKSSTGYSENVLYSFTGSYGDGATPIAGLVMDSFGTLYGTTGAGGSSGAGTVFELVKSPTSPTGWSEKVLHSFADDTDGGAPNGLTMDASGNLYGTTSSGGGPYGDGVVFRLAQSVNFGTVNLGQTSPVHSITFTFNFTSPVQLGSIAVLTKGASGQDFQQSGSSPPGACNTAGQFYGSGGSCTVNVTFSPLAPGPRYGAVVIYDNASPPNALITLYIWGIGVGPAIGFGPGIINTAAGNINIPGTTYSSGGSATSVGLWAPQSMALDAAGNLYIADTNHSVIRKVDTGGNLTTFAGTGTACEGSLASCGDGGAAISAELNYPYAIVLDGAGNLYIADTGDDVVRRVDAATQIITTVAGCTACGSYSGDGGPATGAGLNGPFGVALDGAGNLYIADYGNNVVRKVEAATQIIITVAGNYTKGGSYFGDGGPATGAGLNVPFGVALDAAGNLYIADSSNNTIRKVDAATQTITTVAGNYTKGGTYSGDRGPATSAGLNGPHGVAVDAAGNLYIADTFNTALRKVDAATQTITTAAGTGTPGYSGDGGPATAATLSNFNGIALDATGNIYIADTGDNIIRKVDVSDAPSLTFPNTNVGSTSTAQDVAIENLGNAQLSVTQFSVASNFTLQGGDTSCNTSASSGNPQYLAPSFSCTLGIEFAPEIAGANSGSTILTDNALNVTSATQTILLSGTATGGVPGTVTYLALSAPASATAGSAFSFTVTAKDAFNNAVANYTGTVTFSSSTWGQLPPNYTFQPADAGTKTFTATLDVSGNQTLTVTDTSNPSLTASAQITVNPGNFQGICVSYTSVNATVNAPFSVTVTAGDNYCNPVPGGSYTGTVILSTDDAFAVISPASFTFGGSEQTQFTVTWGTPGIHFLTVTNTANSFVIRNGPIAVSAAYGSTASSTGLTVCANGACLQAGTTSPINVTTEGTIVTLTATVTWDSGPVRFGSVTFWNGPNQPLGTVQVTTMGTATLKRAFAAQSWPYYVTATFNGTTSSVPSFAPSVSPGQQVNVNFVAASTTSLQQQSYPGFPQNPSFLATVSGMGTMSLNGQLTLSDVTSGSGTTLGTQSILGSMPGFLPRVAASLGTGMKPLHLVTADFNGDGIMDVAFVDDASSQVVVLLGNGDGTFRQAGTYGAGTGPRFLVAGDLNGDGLPDLVVVNTGSWGSSTPGTVTVLLNNPSQPGQFSQAPGSPYTVGYFPMLPTLADVNGDGILDLIVPNGAPAPGDWQDPSNISVLLGNGDGTFQPQQQYPAGALAEEALVVGTTSNGAPYLAVLNEYTGVTILAGDGTGEFTTVSSYPVAANTDLQDMAIGDFNGDGRPDIAVANGPDNSVYILLADPANPGQFILQTQAYQIPNTSSPSSQCNPGYSLCGLLAADFNNSGVSSLIAQNWGNGSLTLLQNQSQWSNPPQPGLFNVAGTYPVGSPGRNTIGFLAADFNGDGTLDIVVGNYNDGTIGILPGVTQAPYTFGNIPLAPGNHTIQASFQPNSGSTYGGSLSNTVNVSVPQLAPTHFWIGVSPASVIAGSQVSITVTARDASNNLVSSYSGTVHFTSSDGAAILPANSSLSNGMGTFSVTLATPGAQTVTATDTVSSSISGSTAQIAVYGAGTNPTTTTLTTSTSGQYPGCTNLTVTVSAIGTGTGTAPSGTVIFTNEFNWMFTPTPLQALLTSQSSTVSVLTFCLGVSNHAGPQHITATYSGDASYSSSASSPAVAVDPQGGRQDLGTLPVGQQSSSPTKVWVPIYAGPFTLSSFAVLSRGLQNLEFKDAGGETSSNGGCQVNQTYNAGAICYVNVIFAPTRIGYQQGAIVLYDQNHHQAAIRYLGGTGTGAILALDPGVQSFITGFNNPHGFTSDYSGNLYVANAGGTHQVLRVASGQTDVSTATAIGANLLNPVDVTVDGAGNVFIVDAGAAGANNGQVVRVPYENGGWNSANQVTVLGSANDTISGVNYGAPRAVTVNSFGVLFVAYQNQVVAVRFDDGALNPSDQFLVAGGFTNIAGISMDTPGNLYIADAGGQVVMVPNQNGTYNPAQQQVIGAGLNQPTGVSVDGGLNVYITDSGNQRVVMVPNQNGSYNTAAQTTVSISGLVAPIRAQGSLSGTVYVSDPGSNQVVMVRRWEANLTFAPQAFGTTSPGQALTVWNVGDQPLTLQTPTSTGDSSSFNLSSATSNGCDLTGANALATGYSCGLVVTNQPAKIGALLATATLPSNTVYPLPPSQVTVSENGTGTQAAPVITWPSPAPITYGASLATVLNASGSVPGSFTYSSGATPVNSATVLPVGSYTLTATFTPTDTTDYTTATAAVSLTVNAAPLTVAANNVTVAYGSAMPTLTVGYSGFVNGDTSTVLSGAPDCSTIASFTTAGTFPITCTQGTLAAANYRFLFVPGTLTVNLAMAAVPYMPDGLVGNPYSAQLSASGGSGSYTFAIANGGTLPPGLQLNAGSGVISGTPTTATTAGGTSFTVQATDNSNAASGTAAFTIAVSAAPGGSQNPVFSGTYFLSFYGFDDATGKRLFFMGSFAVDGNGTVSNGLFDVSGETGSFTSAGPVSGTYAIGADYRGILTLNWTGANFTAIPNSGTPGTASVPTLPAVFAVTLSNIQKGVATRGRAIAIDGISTQVHGQAMLRQQHFAAGDSLAGNSYVAVGGGPDLNGNRLYLGWVIGLDGSGNITGPVGSSSSAVVDMAGYSGGQVSAPGSGTLSGSYTFDPSRGRLFLTVSSTVAPPSGVQFPTHYVAYLTNAGTNAYSPVMPVDFGAPLFSSDMYAQSLTFPVGPAAWAGQFLAAEKGLTFNTNPATPFSEIDQGSCNSSAVCTLNERYRFLGSTYANLGPGVASNLNWGGDGRYTFTSSGGTNFFYYLYSASSTSGPSIVYLKVNSSNALLGFGTASPQNPLPLPSPPFGYPQRFAIGAYGPPTITQFDAVGDLSLSPASGAVGVLTGSLDRATQGFVSYADPFGSLTLQAPDPNGVSQLVDSNNNLQAVCILGANTYLNCLPSNLDPNGQTPSVLFLNSVPLRLRGGSANPLQISPANLSVPFGGTQQLTATAFYAYDSTTQDVTRSVTWTSNNPAVAMVTSTGLVTAVGPGTATITAGSYTENNVTGSGSSTEVGNSTTITVTAVTPRFSNLSSQTIIYGQTSITLSGSLNVPSGSTVNVAIGSAGGTATVGSNGAFSVSITVSGLNASATPYTTTYSYAGTADFNAATDSSTTLTVSQATPAITWSNPTSITYGTALSATQLNAAASVQGNFVYSPAAGTVLNAGANQTLSVTFTPNDTADYKSQTASVQISVSPATPTISWATPAAVTYGTALDATQLNATASVPGTFAYTPPAGTVLNAGGSQTLLVTFMPSSSNYTAAPANVQITVNPAPLTVTADNQVMGSGGMLPNLTATYCCLVNGDTASALSGAYTLTASGATSGMTVTSPVTYPITFTNNNLAAANYSLTFVPATLTVLPDRLSLLNNYFITGDYIARGTASMLGTGQGGIATGTITIPGPGSSDPEAIPGGADIAGAYLYWQTQEDCASAYPGAVISFRSSSAAIDYPVINVQVLGDIPLQSPCVAGNPAIRTYRADASAYLPAASNGMSVAPGSYVVKIPDSGPGTGLPQAYGASLVVVYRILGAGWPLKAVVIYDGGWVPDSSSGAMTQTVQGFYDAAGTSPSAKVTYLYSSGGSWTNPVGSPVSLSSGSQFDTPSVAPGAAWGAIILSTPVNSSSGDSLLNAWKTNQGYTSVIDGSWVSLAGATLGQKDVFVQLDYMCSGAISYVNGVPTCDTSGGGQSLLPNPTVLPLVQQAFLNQGIHVHFTIGNAIAQQTCTDDLTANPPQLCEYPGIPGVVDWKAGLEALKSSPRNPTLCAAGGDCTLVFPYGQKDSYHYALFGYATGLPAWSFQDGTPSTGTPSTLSSIVVGGPDSNGVSTVTFNLSVPPGLSSSSPYSPRVTIAGAISQPNLNGTYSVASSGDTSFTIQTTGLTAGSIDVTTDPYLSIGSGQTSTTSGHSDVGGADTMVTLGLWSTVDAARVNVQAGTLMHELGHSLGLTHSGYYFDALPTTGSYVPTFEANCKPNFLSVMNYQFQVDLLGPNGVLDYSGQQLDTLYKTSLRSVAALGMACTSTGCATPTNYSTTKWYAPTAPAGLGNPASRYCDGTPLPSGAPAAYLVNGPTAPTSPPTTMGWANNQDIDYDGQSGETFRGFNDWAHIDLQQLGGTSGDLVDSYYSSASGRLGSGGGRLGSGGGRLGSGGGRLGSGGGRLGSGGGRLGSGGGRLGSGGGRLGSGGGRLGSGGGRLGAGGGNTWGGPGVSGDAGGSGTGEMPYQTANSVARTPGSPSLTTTTNNGVTSVTVSWTPLNFGDVQYYTVYSSVNSGPPTQVCQVQGSPGNPPPTTCPPIQNATPGATYYVTATVLGNPLTPGGTAPLMESSPSVQATQKLSQTITFGPLPNKTVGDPPFQVSATASSGLPVSFLATAGNCAATSSGMVYLSGAGRCTITASQPGNTTYSAATPVSQSFTILQAQAALAVTGVPTTAQAYGTQFTVGSSGGSGTGAVTFTGTGACSASGATVTMTSGTGTCSVWAAKAGDSNCASATSLPATVNAAPAKLTVSANNASMTQGSPVPSLTASYSGFVNGDTTAVLSGAPALSTTASASSPAGMYPITVRQGSLTAANYGFTFVNGTLSVVAPPSVNLVTTVTLSKQTNGNYQAVVKVTNNGTGAASNVQLTTATLGSASGSPFPQTLGTIAANGGSATATITFSSSAGTSGATVIEKYTGTYTGGTFAGSIRAVLP